MYRFALSGGHGGRFTFLIVESVWWYCIKFIVSVKCT